MDSIRGVFSTSSSNFSNPIAESTHLNGSSLHTKFNWGEGPITSRSRNNSMNQSNKTINNTSHITGTPTKVSMSPSSHIDARTYVDIHSNGLASRIVKYHDNSVRLNRSLSVGNLYNKPGQFPVVHLKKNEATFKAKKSRNLSMTRIAAPEKSVFHGNTLSSILRSGSVVGLQKTDEEISRENRPILHPPPTESELAPTRSVLEVLKEISRKRINNDDLDGTELIKKHCKELDAVTCNGQKTIQSKRQREAALTPNTQVSPEQAVKKRMCNYNNDIMSSLSSSMISVNKKKMFNTEVQSTNSSSTMQINSTNLTSSVAPSSSRDEQAHGCTSLELENFLQSKYTPVTPLPSTPQQIPSECVVQEKCGIVSRRASEPVISSTKPKLTLFNKNYDDSPYEVHNETPEPNDDDDLSGIQFVKPKKSSSLSSGGTLLIEKTKKSKLALMLSGLKGELNEDDEVDAPQKEQKNSQTSTSVATSVAASTALPTSAVISFGTTTTTATTPITLPSTASTSATTVSKPSATTVNPLQPKELKTGSLTSAVTNEIKLNTPTSTVASTQSSTPAVASSASTTSNPMLQLASKANSIPTLSGFNFGQNKQLSVPSVTTAPALVTPLPKLAAAQAPTMSIATTTAIVPISSAPTAEAAKPFTFGTLTTKSTTSTTPAFTFGSSPSLTGSNPLSNSFANAKAASTATPNNPPVFGQSAASAQPTFTFGSLAESKPNNTSNAITPTTSAPVSTAPPAFSFGASATSSQANTVMPAPKGSFSGITTSSLTQPAASATPSIGGFSFGATSATEAPKSLFGSVAAVTSNPTQPSSTPAFSFSANKAPTAQANATSAFTFGSAATSAASPAQPPPMFGSTTPANSFSFGSAAPAAAPLKGSLSFSSADKPAASSTTGPAIGGFSFNAPVTSSLSAPEPSKNLFAVATTTTAPTKAVFSFGSPSVNQAEAKPSVFGASAAQPTPNLFAAPATTTAQNSPFAFGSSSSTNNQVATTKPSMNSIFGTAASGPSSSSTAASNSIFGGQTTTTAAPQPSSTFNFGASSSNAVDNNKPAGGFVFGSSSSIGSNASKPATDMNKTFVFGDGSTTITPAPAASTNLFGSSSTATSANAGGSDNKLFSFGGASAAAAPANNNAFGASRQSVNPSPAFNFGASSSAAPTAQAPAANLFAPQPAGVEEDPGKRRIKKAMRRLHKA